MPDRRQFLQFLAGSPILAAAGLDLHRLRGLASSSPRRSANALSLAHQAMQNPAVIHSASEALDVFDFEPVARVNIPVAHWAYLAGGTDDDGTIQANREGFTHWALKPRRLVDVHTVDAGVSLLGTRYAAPIVINPVGSQKAFHPLGEIAVARAAKARNHLQVLSTVATTSIEDAIAARGGTVWFQLYHQDDWAITKQMVQRAERAGSAAVVFTVDLNAGSNRETMIRGGRLDKRVCTACHLGGPPMPGVRATIIGDNRRKPNLNGYPPVTPIPEVGTPSWEFIDRLKAATSMKVFIKGIVTREDAELAVEHGVDGLFCSNHGGRAENSLRATIASLPEVVQGTAGRIPVICDGGFRRGTDVFKAMALGAASIGIGRPYIWGLGAFGQEGVETVLTLLRREFELVMKQMGVTSVAAISKSYLVAAAGVAPRSGAMRLWSLHPKYLDRQGLLALWREGLLAQAVLRGRTRGYRSHPQLERFRKASRSVGLMAAYLRAVWEEAARRGYRFDAGRIAGRPSGGRIAVPVGQLRWEWGHLRRKLRVRSPELYRHCRDIAIPQAHPMFRKVAGGRADWERGPVRS